MNRTAYTLLLRAAAPVVWLGMAWSARRSKTVWAVLSRERFGFSARTVAGAGAPMPSTVWVHAVSVGETRAAQPLIRALLARGDSVLLTHTTPTGRQTGQALFADARASGQLRQAWLPYDFPGACARFLTVHAPRLAVLIEREVWPNMVAACGAANIPVALVSARMSERGLRRTLRLGLVLKQAYAGLNIVCAQSQEDALRLQAAGVGEASVSGNLKFDVALDEQQLARGRAWRQSLNRPVVALVSTREGEDEMFAQAIGKLAGVPLLDDDVGDDGQADPARAMGPVSPLVVWVPRHAQRFDEVAETLAQRGLVLARRSNTADVPGQAVQVYLGDTLGDMAFYLGAANVAVIGGSFAPLGAQNFIEACAAGVPVILGPSVYNFKDAAGDALAQGLVTQVASADEAVALAWQTCARGNEQAAFAQRARAWLTTHVGATQRILDCLPNESACAAAKR